MIVFDVKLKSWIDKAHKAHHELEQKIALAQTVYFLIGSFCSDGDFHVAHAAKCSLPETAEDMKGDNLSKNVDDEWLADCAEKVIRLLPGGLHIVGLACFSTKKVFNDQKLVLNRALSRIQRINSSLTTLNIDNISDIMSLVLIDSTNCQPSGIIVNTVNRGPDSPTKVSFTQLEWVSLVSNASTRVALNLPENGSANFYKSFSSTLKPFAENLFSCGLIAFDDKIRSGTESLCSNAAKKKTSFDCQIFVDSFYGDKNEVTHMTAENLLEISFDVEIRAAVPMQSKVDDALRAVRHHIIRSLTSRAELQFESMELVEDTTNVPCSVHQLPRSVTAVLPGQPAIVLTDYLFEADSIEDAQSNFCELLQVNAPTDSINDNWERHFYEGEVLDVKTPLEDKPVVSFRSSSGENASQKVLLVALAALFAIAAVVVFFTMGH